MSKVTRLFCAGAALTIAACDSTDQSRDFSIDKHSLAEMKAGIWIDPNGCDHWIIDNWVEGYMSPRLDPSGRPVCSGIGEPGQAIWDYEGARKGPDTLF